MRTTREQRERIRNAACRGKVDPWDVADLIDDLEEGCDLLRTAMRMEPVLRDIAARLANDITWSKLEPRAAETLSYVLRKVEDLCR